MGLTVRGIRVALLAEQGPGVFEVRDDPRLAQHHDVILGQEVQRRRMLRPGEQHHAPGLRDACPGPTLNALKPSPASLPLQACRRSVVHSPTTSSCTRT